MSFLDGGVLNDIFIGLMQYNPSNAVGCEKQNDKFVENLFCNELFHGPGVKKIVAFLEDLKREARVHGGEA